MEENDVSAHFAILSAVAIEDAKKEGREFLTNAMHGVVGTCQEISIFLGIIAFISFCAGIFVALNINWSYPGNWMHVFVFVLPFAFWRSLKLLYAISVALLKKLPLERKLRLVSGGRKYVEMLEPLNAIFRYVMPSSCKISENGKVELDITEYELKCLRTNDYWLEVGLVLFYQGQIARLREGADAQDVLATLDKETEVISNMRSCVQSSERKSKECKDREYHLTAFNELIKDMKLLKLTRNVTTLTDADKAKILEAAKPILAAAEKPLSPDTD